MPCARFARLARRAAHFTAHARPRAVHALRARLPQLDAAAGPRSLPNFIILGAQRSGTTTMHDALAMHPQVRRALTKETHFFTLGYQPDARAYRAWFPRASGLEGGLVTGEATPAYLFHPLAADRMARMLPNTRFIVLLREPVSHYHHSVRRGQEPLPLMEALRAEDKRLSDAARHGPGAGRSFYAHSYAARGRYAEQLGRFFAAFERCRFLILRSEVFFAEPVRVLRRVCEFLDLDPDRAPAVVARANAVPAAGPTDPRAVSYLKAHFGPHNARLGELLGDDVAWEGGR